MLKYTLNSSVLTKVKMMSGFVEYKLFAGLIFLASLIVLPSDAFEITCHENITTSGSVALTFDDYFIEDWVGISSMLNDMNVNATFFIAKYHNLNFDQKEMIKKLIDDGHEIGMHGYDHANALAYCPKNSDCNITMAERAQFYIDEQILPQLNLLNQDEIWPANFAYPGGFVLRETTSLLLEHFDFVRRTSYFPRIENAFVAKNDTDRLIGALGIDHVYGISNENYISAFERARCSNETLVLYGHRVNNHTSDYYVGKERLFNFIKTAQGLGLVFRRVSDIPFNNEQGLEVASTTKMNRGSSTPFSFSVLISGVLGSISLFRLQF
jgi:peptidoglycan/xylan/chitin deacetylase (PgdA/CDA1 family)